jgi:3-hydroxyisobutyrate dehydrogenase-like beta-hydroxyacid dehydrogenase
MTTVAFLGLGAMGAPMAGNLIEAGFALRVYNRSAQRAQPLAARGAVVCASPAEAVHGAAFVVSMVSDDSATREVMTGPQGALTAVAPGTVIVDSSTNTPRVAREMAETARARGAFYLDAPVSGSIAQAKGRELVIMVGGEAEALERARALLEAMGRMIRHAGPSGAGATLKLVNNMLSGTVNAALAEAVTVIEGAGLDSGVALEVLAEGAAGCRLTKTKIPKMLARDFSAQFQLGLMEKDLRYFLSLADELDRPAQIAALVRGQFQAARRAGLGALDVSAIYQQTAGEPSGR